MNVWPRPRVRLGLAAIALLALLASGPPTAARAALAVKVLVAETADEETWGFDRPDLTIETGQSVVWENSGLSLHTVTADDESWDSGILDTSQQFTVAFPEAGTYAYHCRFHDSMRGVVVVQEPGPPARLYFSETGFAIDEPAFADYFRSRGGLRTLAYPVSRPFIFQGRVTQVFQRFVLQRAADGHVEVLDLLDSGLLPFSRISGSLIPDRDSTLVASAPAPFDPDYPRLVAQFVRSHAPDELHGLPVGFGAAFFGSVTCDDAFPRAACQEELLPLMDLELWGLPDSAPTPDPRNGDFIYLRFERGVLLFDARSGSTQGLLLGALFKSVLTGQDLPADVAAQAAASPLLEQYDPRRPGSIARPAQLPDSDLTGAFTPDAG